MLKRFLIVLLASALAGCAGIRFCDEHGKPKGCQQWDPGKDGTHSRS